MSDFYKAFEDRYRGSRELIFSRLRTYEPFLLGVKNAYDHVKATDLGCGRGEWLQLLREYEIDALGIDVDEEMLQPCRSLGLRIRVADAISHLKEGNDESEALISGFHIAEHLSFEKLRELVGQAHRVLRPGGLLILETPNPENIFVGASSFYLDPTHIKPIPPRLLHFIFEYEGFARTKIMFLQEDSDLREKQDVTLSDVLTGASPDYAIVAQKRGNAEQTAALNYAFSREWGLPIAALMASFELRLKNLRNHPEIGIFRQRLSALQNTAVDVTVQTTEHSARIKEHGCALEIVAIEAKNNSAELDDRLRTLASGAADAESRTSDRLAQYEERLHTLATGAADAESHTSDRLAQYEERLHTLATGGADAASRTSDRLARYEERLCALESAAIDAKTKATQLSTRLDERIAQLTAMEGSLSWRLTRPLREANTTRQNAVVVAKKELRAILYAGWRSLRQTTAWRAFRPVLRAAPALEARLQRMALNEMERRGLALATSTFESSAISGEVVASRPGELTVDEILARVERELASAPQSRGLTT